MKRSLFRVLISFYHDHMKLTLTSKINIIIIATTLVTSVSLNLIFRECYLKMVMMNIEEQILEISRLKVWNLAEHSERKEHQQIYDKITADISALKNVTNIQFYDRNGYLTIDKDGFKRQLPSDQWIIKGIESRSRLHAWNGFVLRHFEPIMHEKEVVGFLYIEYNAGFVSHQLKKIVAVMVSATSVLALLFIVAAMAFSRRLTTPLVAVTDASKRVAAGDLSVHVDLKSKDELGVLSENFNKMVKSLNNHLAERKRFEAELQAAIKKTEDEKSRSAAIIDAIGDGISIQDTDFKILYQNQVNRDMIGDNIGEYCYNVYEYRHDVCEECPVAAAFEDGKIHTMERNITTDSGLRRVEVTASPLKDSSGEIVAGIEAVRDITARKQTEDSLRLLKEAVEALPIGITIINTEEKIIYINPAESEMHGYPMDEIIGKDARMFAPRESWNPMAFEQLHAMGIYKRESMNIRLNGEVFPAQLTSIAVRDVSGTPIGIITACEDITERKQMLDMLILQQDALQTVYKMATTLGSSFKSVCDDVISGLVRLLRVSHIMVLRRKDGMIRVISAIVDGNFQPTDVVCPEKDCPCVSAYEKKAACQIDGFPRDICSAHPFAEYDLKSMLCVPILDTAGNVAGTINISDRMKQSFSEDEINLIKVFARYIAFVVEREAMEERLRNAQKMEVIGKLAGGVAHEVRNPLHAIMAISEALSLDLGDDDENTLLLAHIREQVDRLSALMTDLLDLGKPIEQFDMHRESVAEICFSCMDIWKQSDLGRSHEVRMVQPESIGTISVRADGRRLQQVFLNLLDNAAQHAPESSEIQIMICEPKGKTCAIQVIDRGSGIPPDILSHIFEPFFSTRRGGTGLGMSIVKHIVEAHGGTIVIVNNNPPPGCAVEIRLPIEDEER
jgi:PAS domain S-box-containing protein